MPPKLRGVKNLRKCKENITINNQERLKNKNTGATITRKALADKTNSASDDNEKIHPNVDKATKTSRKNADLPKRRERRIPLRYAGNTVLTNLSNNSLESSITQDTPLVKLKVQKKPATKNIKDKKITALKNITKVTDNSILKSRPRRICRLPSKLDDHSISPHKYIPLQPVSASTPIANKISKEIINKDRSDITIETSNSSHKKNNKKRILQKKRNNSSKVASDSNNNGKKQLQIDKCFEKQVNLNQIRSKRLLDVDFSFKVLNDVKVSLKRDTSKLDPYEFTFDPEEEPQKKKKKRVVKKSQTKPKTFVSKGNYEKNLAKALATLRSNVAKPTKPNVNHGIKSLNVEPAHTLNSGKGDLNINDNQPKLNDDLTKSINERNYNSVRIEDIAMDLQEVDNTHNINYSPVNSPHPSVVKVVVNDDNQKANNSKDPLNLQEMSFFDDQPVASSSMNVSVRHPLASPWRVEFGSLPIKWQANTYVKPNMTPAVECSFINPNDSKKKHVYTNIISQANDSLPQLLDEPPILKQTSIISFIKEIAEKSVNKKNKSTPIKSNSLFEDITNKSLIATPLKNISSRDNSSSIDTDNENSVDNLNNPNSKENESMKTPIKKKNKRNTYFGFDESNEQDLENISPNKKDNRIKSLRPRGRGALQEINDMKGPTRAVIVTHSKPLLNSDNLNKHYEDPKSGTEPPFFPEKVAVEANMESNLNSLDNDESQTLHLFEDMDLMHHYQQPHRKSYGKPKKVTFRQNSASDSDNPLEAEERAPSSDEDNLEDLSFKLPTVKPKRIIKKKPKKKLSKKEEKAVEEWAAGFNSMCEDIEEFDLVVE